ncbi:MAG: hypothetical protein FRX48_05314 [Lasallia pustulata]|uniref:Uncharacterized protein n=1 Tax=Lasallia pustulata TaxID=136370 RepID=A0A5M8PNG4_9LECA|nr:MAG: hypothetical protein FRX48_05314 [Lasallia pustulata]
MGGIVVTHVLIVARNESTLYLGFNASVSGVLFLGAAPRIAAPRIAGPRIAAPRIAAPRRRPLACHSGKKVDVVTYRIHSVSAIAVPLVGQRLLESYAHTGSDLQDDPA